MFDGLIDGSLARALAETAAEAEITELRLRAGRPAVVMTVSDRRIVKNALGGNYVVGQGDIERILQVASDYSVYSVNEELTKGFLARKGVRIGVSGEGVTEREKLITVKNVCALAIRIPHQIMNAADGIRDVVLGGDVKSTLVISPPGAGKTTMLRELARLASERFNTLIIDERYEIACCVDGMPTLDVGECDVMSGIPKTAAYESGIRAMNPEVIVTDELFRAAEADAAADIMRSGVRVFASVHGDGIDSIRRSRVFGGLTECFDVAVVLSKRGRIGRVEQVSELWKTR